jgi:DHA2 family multidrug resistance protein
VQGVQALTGQGMSEQGAWAVIDRTMSVQASTMAATDIFWISAMRVDTSGAH